jgi:hypothetical protein
MMQIVVLHVAIALNMGRSLSNAHEKVIKRHDKFARNFAVLSASCRTILQGIGQVRTIGVLPQVPVIVGSAEFSVKFDVVAIANQPGPLLSNDWLIIEVGANIDFSTGQITIRRGAVRVI